MDPANENSVPFHQNQGSASANLLGRLQNGRTIPPDTDSFTVRPTTNVSDTVMITKYTACTTSFCKCYFR